MDFYKKFKNQLGLRVTLAILFPLIVSSATWTTLTVLEYDQSITIGLSIGVGLGIAVFSIMMLIASVSKTYIAFNDAIAYAFNRNSDNQPPNVEKLRLGREMLMSFTRQLYDMASTSENTTSGAQSMVSADNPINSVPIPIIGFDSKNKITVANVSASEYLKKGQSEILGRAIYDVLNLSFSEEETLDSWLKSARGSSVTAQNGWDKVRHNIEGDDFVQFDLVASFSSGKTDGTETMLALFDRTAAYTQEDQDIGYVALAVHELRTPLTIMRGYIEVFEDELSDQLDPEMKDFMRKMQASSQQLAAFVANILKVARVEENQLDLRLREEDIDKVVHDTIHDLELRARVHGKHIELAIAKDLPTVAIDKISIYEVINNLIDNALKYSGKSEKIRVNVNTNSEGLVQIDVQDFGVGIPSNVMPNLFKKFHRSYKTNTEVTGTGLGLYLSKALINAHGGNIWVRSKENEGTTFSFTIIPYDQMSSEDISNEDGIIRGAHGWIKNHSLYRS